MAEYIENAGFQGWASATDVDAWAESLGGTSSISRLTGEYGDALVMTIDSTGGLAYIAQNITLPTVGTECYIDVRHQEPLGGQIKVTLNVGASYLKPDGTWASSVTEHLLVSSTTVVTYRVKFTSPGGEASVAISRLNNVATRSKVLRIYACSISEYTPRTVFVSATGTAKTRSLSIGPNIDQGSCLAQSAIEHELFIPGDTIRFVAGAGVIRRRVNVNYSGTEENPITFTSDSTTMAVMTPGPDLSLGWENMGGGTYRAVVPSIPQTVYDLRGVSVLSYSAGGYPSLSEGQWDYNSGFLYVRLTGGTNPSGNVEAPIYRNNFYGENSNHIVIDNLHMCYAEYESGQGNIDLTGHDIKIKNCKTEWAYHGPVPKGGSNIIVHNNYCTDHYSGAIVIASFTAGAATGCKIFSNFVARSGVINEAIGAHGSATGPCTISGLQIYDNDVFCGAGYNHGIRIREFVTAEIRSNRIYNTAGSGAGIYALEPDATICSNIMTDCSIGVDVLDDADIGLNLVIRGTTAIKVRGGTGSRVVLNTCVGATNGLSIESAIASLVSGNDFVGSVGVRLIGGSIASLDKNIISATTPYLVDGVSTAVPAGNAAINTQVSADGRIVGAKSIALHSADHVPGLTETVDPWGNTMLKYPNIGADQYDYAPGYGPWSPCDASLPTDGTIFKSHTAPIAAKKLTVFPGVASAAQIAEASDE